MEQDGEDRRDPRPHEHAEERGKLLIRAGRKVVDAGRLAVDAAGHVGEASIELLVRAFQARESNFHLRVLTRTLSRPAAARLQYRPVPSRRLRGGCLTLT